MFLWWQKFVNIDYKTHLFCSIVLRLILITYGIYHDHGSEVKYTDIDYTVFTDASRHVLNGNSPYERHTYRYSPFVAIFLIPNVILHNCFGKVLFSIVDIIVALLIRILVVNSIKEYECYKQKYSKTVKMNQNRQLETNFKNRKKLRQTNKQQMNFTKAEIETKNNINLNADIAMISWLYNPLTIAIATRGNCDSMAGFFVLITLYFLQCKRSNFIAGLLHGFSIHFRLYPIIYSLTMFMFLSKFSYYISERHSSNILGVKTTEIFSKTKHMENTLVENSLSSHKIIRERKTIFKWEYLLYLVPNLEQLKLIFGCLFSLSCLTCLFYYLYGFKFLYETYIYHLIRTDTRHNFSLYFYLQYLTAWVKNIGLWQKILKVLPQIILLLVLSIRYGLNRFSLNFSILTQTITMVIYNGVLTSQYFVWIMVVLPLCLWQIKIPSKITFFLLTIWFVAQGVWLLPAYLLEFQGQNTFLFIWIQSVSFFCANIAILGRLIMYFMPIKDKSS